MAVITQNLHHTNCPTTHFLQLADDRRIAYLDLGDRMGHPVFFCHGSPGSRLEAVDMIATTQAQGFRIIAPDRPGMGRSDFKPGYSLLDYTQDIQALANHLGVQQFGVIGHSGGGTIALACAYAMPERLNFVIDLAGWAPINTPELRQEMTLLDRFFADRCLIPTQKGEHLIPPLFQFPFTLIGLASRGLPAQLFLGLLNQSQYFSEADQAVLKQHPDQADFLLSTVREAFAQGSEGASYDALLHYRDWGFALEAITIPVHLMHGTADLSVPYKFSEYKRQHIPQSQLITYSNEGHFFPWSHWNEIFQLAQTLINQ